MPGGTDCERPACDDIKKYLGAPTLDWNQVGSSRNKSSSVPSKSTDCPLRSPQLGRSSWGLLHSMAAWYPDKPTTEQKSRITNFFQALAEFYPCEYCAKDFEEKLKEQPIRAESREELCKWLCQQHNFVNEKLGKPIMPCDMKTLDKRWRKNNDPNCKSR